MDLNQRVQPYHFYFERNHMKTRLEYHLRKFKKRYQFKQIGNDPNYGTISIDGYVFKVVLDLRKIGRQVTRPYYEFSIMPSVRCIYISRLAMSQKQCLLYSSLYHEIAHFILYLMKYDMDYDTTEGYCDLFSAIHTGRKNQHKATNYARNRRHLDFEVVAVRGTRICFEKFTEFFTLRYAETSIYPDTSWFKVRARTANVYTKRRNRTYVKQVVKVTCSIHFLNIILSNIFLSDFRTCYRRRVVERLYKDATSISQDPVLNDLKNVNPEVIMNMALPKFYPYSQHLKNS